MSSRSNIWKEVLVNTDNNVNYIFNESNKFDLKINGLQLTLTNGSPILLNSTRLKPGAININSTKGFSPMLIKIIEQ
jgi:hypothetical protein